MASVATIQFFVCDYFDAGGGEMSRLLRVDVRARMAHAEPDCWGTSLTHI